MTTWRDGVELIRAWARAGGNVIDPGDARCIGAFYDAFTLHCGRDGGRMDDEMPAEVVEQLKRIQ
ncbi:hypothetical protein KIP88_02485 [Bradyrhizobium sp. SRL28]|uniref:hypothetical protein n=1 Tax=Bradyrhizobium sp. SRL28 TaxID=2836178 RepID=UPI001BDF40AB|nr:hypothetical protein [Bradyrhizobium sp. SRL28]MBT1509357.1 hypothetical protein [Bradyrhizobium sp. SRL28]